MVTSVNLINMSVYMRVTVAFTLKATTLQAILMHEVKTHCPNIIVVNINKVLKISMFTSFVYIGEKLKKLINVQLIGDSKQC